MKSKFLNKGSIISIVSLAILLLMQFTDIKTTDLDKVVQAVTTLGVITGILNNPNTKGIDSFISNNKEDLESGGEQ